MLFKKEQVKGQPTLRNAEKSTMVPQAAPVTENYNQRITVCLLFLRVKSESIELNCAKFLKYSLISMSAKPSRLSPSQV